MFVYSEENSLSGDKKGHPRITQHQDELSLKDYATLRVLAFFLRE